MERDCCERAARGAGGLARRDRLFWHVTEVRVGCTGRPQAIIDARSPPPAALPPGAPLGAALCCVAAAFSQSHAAARPKLAGQRRPAAARCGGLGALRWARRAAVGSARCSQVGWHAVVGSARCGGLSALQWTQHAAVGLTPPPPLEPSGAEWRMRSYSFQRAAVRRHHVS